MTTEFYLCFSNTLDSVIVRALEEITSARAERVGREIRFYVEAHKGLFGTAREARRDYIATVASDLRDYGYTFDLEAEVIPRDLDGYQVEAD